MITPLLRENPKNIVLLISVILIAFSVNSTVFSNVVAVNTLSLSCQTDQEAYYLREPVILRGNLTENGQPANESLVAVEVRDTHGNSFLYRTLPIGNPQERWGVNITDIRILDSFNNLLDAAKVDSTVKLRVVLKNNLGNPLDIVLAYTLHDKTLIPIRSGAWQVQIGSNTTSMFQTQIQIPRWASPGKGLLTTNVYNKHPKDGGIPHIPEKLTDIYITRNDELPPPYTSSDPNSCYTQLGNYEIYFRMPPDQYIHPGTFNVFATARKTPINLTIQMTSTSTTFNMKAEPSPPQAAFTWYPPKLYENMTGTFDASSSSAEGYNDTIIRYQWYFDDPHNPEEIVEEGNYTHPPSPLAYHIFEHLGEYTISLNVTDNEGLWSYTLKPITIYQEFGPTANFTWEPEQPRANATTTFNATSTQLGWSVELGNYSQIINYTWNFGDGTGNYTTTSPIHIYVYPQNGTFTVTLTIIDSVGRTNTTSKIIEVIEAPTNPYDVNGDGYVGVDDIVLTAENFGNSPGDPDWNPAADVNGDGYGGIDDIVAVAEHFGEEY